MTKLQNNLTQALAAKQDLEDQIKAIGAQPSPSTVQQLAQFDQDIAAARQQILAQTPSFEQAKQVVLGKINLLEFETSFDELEGLLAKS
jgi:hypothetical protein